MAKRTNKFFIEIILPVFLHLGIWVFIFSSPLLFSEKISMQYISLRYWIPTLFALFLFYLNFFQLLPKLLFKKKWISFFLINFILITCFLFLIDTFSDFIRQSNLFTSDLNELGTKRRPGTRNGFLSFYRQIPILLLSLGSAMAIRYSQKIVILEKLQKEKENENLKSELSALKYQIQPHFLFNTLNNIYSLSHTNINTAQDAIIRLSNLMRYLLYKTKNETIYLSDEIDFIESYIDLMKLRYGNHLEVIKEFPKTIDTIKIPPLLLVTVAENAFKHGVDNEAYSLIKFNLKIESKAINFEVINTYFPKTAIDKSGSGIGIENLKKRLKHLYNSDDYSFQQFKEGDFYISKLNFKYFL